MLRKIGLALVCASGLVSTNAFASVQPLAPVIEYQFYPHKAEVLKNFSIWHVRASCTISSEDELNRIHVHMKRKSAQVNGVLYTVGEAQDLTLISGATLAIDAEGGAEVEITNIGEKMITAVCTA